MKKPDFMSLDHEKIDKLLDSANYVEMINSARLSEKLTELSTVGILLGKMLIILVIYIILADMFRIYLEAKKIDIKESKLMLKKVK